MPSGQQHMRRFRGLGSAPEGRCCLTKLSYLNSPSCEGYFHTVSGLTTCMHVSLLSIHAATDCPQLVGYTFMPQTDATGGSLTRVSGLQG